MQVAFDVGHLFLNNVFLFLFIFYSTEITTLTEDMYACGNQIIEHFTGAKSAVSQGSDNLKSNPAKLCYVLKQCVRECAVGEFLLLFVDLYDDPF